MTGTILPADPLDQVTPLILTCNEEANISRTLAGLAWARRIVVIDSGSTDGTLAILAGHPAVEVLHRPFDSFAAQCNFGLGAIHSEWVLSLDADYWLPPALVDEMRHAVASCPPDLAGFRIPFRYCVLGRPLRGSILPPRLCLYRLGSGAYVDDGHGHRYQAEGRTGRLPSAIHHDDRKPLSRWLDSQRRYVAQEATKLLTTPVAQLSFADRLRRRHLIAPFAVLLACLVLRGGLLDGWRGWYYAFQRLYVEVLLSLMLWEERRGRAGATGTADG
jgi:glycosyltransferase involved in cell wall biosynthesis